MLSHIFPLASSFSPSSTGRRDERRTYCPDTVCHAASIRHYYTIHIHSVWQDRETEKERERELMMYRLSHSSLLSNLHANAELKLNGGLVKNSTHLLSRAAPSQLTTANHKSLYWRVTSHRPIKGSISTGNWYCWSCTEELWWPDRKRENRWKIDLIVCTIRILIYRGQWTVIYYSTLMAITRKQRNIALLEIKELECLDVQPDADKYIKKKSSNHKNLMVKANHLCEILKWSGFSLVLALISKQACEQWMPKCM